MEHMERLIPLAVLLGVAAFLAFLLRRVMRETTSIEPRREIAGKPEPVAIIVAPKEETQIVVATVDPPKVEHAPMPAPPLDLPKRVKPKRVVPVGPTKTPIHGALDLLQDK